MGTQWVRGSWENYKNSVGYHAAVVAHRSALGTPFGQNPECLGVPESRRHAARISDAVTQRNKVQCAIHSTNQPNGLGVQWVKC